MVWTRRQRIIVVTLGAVAIMLALLVVVQLVVSLLSSSVSRDASSWQVTVDKLNLTPGTCLVAPITDTEAAASTETKLPDFDPMADTQTSVSCSAVHQAEVLRIVFLPGTKEWSGDLEGEDGFGTPGGKTLNQGADYTKSSCATAGSLLENTIEPGPNDLQDFKVVPVVTGLDDADILGICLAVFDAPTAEDVGLSRLLENYANGETAPQSQLVEWTQLHEGACLGSQTRLSHGSVTEPGDPFRAIATDFALVGCDTLHSAEVLRVVTAKDGAPAAKVCSAAGTLLKTAGGSAPKFSVETLGSGGNDDAIVGVCAAVFDKPVASDTGLSERLDSLAT
jgi:hypothetical protein